MFSESISAVVKYGPQSLVNIVVISLAILLVSYCIKLTIDNLMSKKVLKFGTLIKATSKEMNARLQQSPKLPNQPQKPKPSWIVVAIMSWFSACTFLCFMMLVVLGVLAFSKLSIPQAIGLVSYWLVLIVAARFFYAEAHRERAKIINIDA